MVEQFYERFTNQIKLKKNSFLIVSILTIWQKNVFCTHKRSAINITLKRKITKQECLEIMFYY